MAIRISTLNTASSLELTDDTVLVINTPAGVTKKTTWGELRAATSCLCVSWVKMEIPTAEVLTLNSTPIAFGITVPSGYYLQPISAIVKSTYAGTPYATNTSMRIRAVGSSVWLFVFDLNYTADQFTQLAYSSLAAVEFIEGVDLEVYVNTGDPTAGDSDIDLYITYVLMPI